MSRDLAYRPEIDGLRAIAVLSVILDHAGIKIFRGGFIGVDIFFVISGFLISSIILKSFQANSFSLLDFYERRARRILPTLFVVILCTLPMSWHFMFPSQMLEYGKSICSIIVFLSNFFFWKTDGYFDQISDLKPLLHTWSLGIEEQFYLFFPLCFIFFLKNKSKNLLLFLVCACIISLSFSEVFFHYGKTSMNFFLLPSRAWELFLGVIIAIINSHKPCSERFNKITNNLFSLMGLFMIFYSIMFFSPKTAIPSLIGLIPTIGTALVIGFAGKDTVTKKILSITPLVFIGLISYSLYLWHQPAFAFARLALANPDQYLGWIIFFIFILSVFSFQFIEKPFRNPTFISSKKFFVLFGIFSVVLFACGFWIVIKKGFESRFSEEWVKWSDHKSNAQYVFKRAISLDKNFEKNQKKKILIVGDSFSQDLVNEIFENNELKDFQIRTLKIIADCQIYYGPYDENVSIKNKHVCKIMHEKLLSERVNSADIIIFASAWKSWSARRLKDTLRRLKLRKTQKIIIIGTKYFGKIHFKSLSRLSLQERIALREDITKEKNIQTNRILNRDFEDKIIIPTDLICSKKNKKTICPLFTPQGELLAYDGSHLTKEGAKFLGAKLMQDKKFIQLLH